MFVIKNNEFEFKNQIKTKNQNKTKQQNKTQNSTQIQREFERERQQQNHAYTSQTNFAIQKHVYMYKQKRISISTIEFF
jgi:hypothetical protein